MSKEKNIPSLSIESDTPEPEPEPEPVLIESPSNEGSQASNSSSSGMGSFVDAVEDFESNNIPDGPPSENSASSLVMVDAQDGSVAEEASQESNVEENPREVIDSSGPTSENSASSLVKVDSKKDDASEETSQEPNMEDRPGTPSESSSSSLVVVETEEDGTTEEKPQEPNVEESDFFQISPIKDSNEAPAADSDNVNDDGLIEEFLTGAGGLGDNGDARPETETIAQSDAQKEDQSEEISLEAAVEERKEDISTSMDGSNNAASVDRPTVEEEIGTDTTQEVDEVSGPIETSKEPNVDKKIASLMEENISSLIPTKATSESLEKESEKVDESPSVDKTGTDQREEEPEVADKDDDVVLVQKGDFLSMYPMNDDTTTRKVPTLATKPVMPEIAYSKPESATTEDSEHDTLTSTLSNDVSHYTTGSQTTIPHRNSRRRGDERTHPRPMALEVPIMASVNENVSTELDKSNLPRDAVMVSPPYDEWAARQGCVPPPPVFDDYEMVNMDKETRANCQPEVVERTGSGGSNSSASSAAPTETFVKLAPVKAANGFFVDMGRLIVVGVLSLVGGAFGSLFADTTCNFANISKPVGYYGEVLTVHVGMSRFTSIDSVFQGQSFCVSYDHQYYSMDPPAFARTCGAFALIAGALASMTVWFYVFTKRTSVPTWNIAICFAVSASLSQLLTFQFFWSSVCEEEACSFGAGSYASLMAAAVYAYTAFEMHRNSPVRGIAAIDKESLLSGSAFAYKAPEMV